MTWVDARLDFNNIKLDETMKAITVDELHRIWLPIITLSWVTPEFGPSTLQWQNANSGVCQAGNPAQTLMRETNMRKFNRLIETFHKSWSEKMLPALLESLQLSTKDGKAKLELQFGRPGLTTSSKVSLQQAILLVHHTAVGLAVLKGRHRKSGQDGGGQLCSRLPVQLLLMVLLQHQSTQAVDQNQEASNPPGKASDTHADCTKSWIQRRDEK